VPPSRALSKKKGDQQSRAELLGKLLVAAGEKAYIVQHGKGEGLYFLVMVPVTDDEVKQWTESLKSAPTVITVDSLKLMPLQLEKDAAVGSIDAAHYDPAEGKGWTAAVTVAPCK